MKIFSLYTTLLSCLVASIAASENAITYPGSSVSVAAGDTINIQWNPSAGSKVSLKLRYGNPANLNEGTTIALAVANTGSFFWVIPSNIGNGQWSIAITDGKDEDANYSPMFAITGGTGTQGSFGSASATPAPTTAAISAASAFLATATGGASPTGAAVKVGARQVGGFAALAGLGALVL